MLPSNMLLKNVVFNFLLTCIIWYHRLSWKCSLYFIFFLRYIMENCYNFLHTYLLQISREIVYTWWFLLWKMVNDFIGLIGKYSAVYDFKRCIFHEVDLSKRMKCVHGVLSVFTSLFFQGYNIITISLPSFSSLQTLLYNPP